jgi:hypothetical protein
MQYREPMFVLPHSGQERAVSGPEICEASDEFDFAAMGTIVCLQRG